MENGGLLFLYYILLSTWLGWSIRCFFPKAVFGVQYVVCGARAKCNSSSQQSAPQPWQGGNTADLVPAEMYWFGGGGQETRCPSWFECQLLSSWHPQLFPWQQLFVLGDKVMHLWSSWKGQWANVHYLKLLSSSMCLSITLKLGE